MQQSRFLMCPPPHFGVHYVINPWMEGQLHATDGPLAFSQWAQLHGILDQYAKVALLPAVPGLPDLVFTANAAVIHRQRAILSNFRYPERQAEAPHFAAWLKQDGFNVSTLPQGVFFEGAGDALLDRKQALLWFGHGFRSDLSAKPYLESWMDVEVQPLRLIDPRFYHLDTCFCPLESGYLLYYPAAFDDASNSAIQVRVPADHRLAVSEYDAMEFACNAVNIGNKVILNNASDDTVNWLAGHGFETVKTRMYEFMKAGGAAKCLSLRLDEA
jgi:N-dimethylarginine dimethylaminohydrolase